MKKLKQSSLFEKLKKAGVPFTTYVIIYHVYMKHPVKDSTLLKIPEDYFNGKELTAKAIALLESVDSLFYARKKIKLSDVLGDDYMEKLKGYVELFPKGKLGSGSYARSNVKDLERNFLWFFQEYADTYSWETIIKATEFYIEEQRRADYKYTQTSMYFIRKADVNKIVKSNLANYCDKIMNGDDFSKENSFFKTKVI